MGITHIGLSSFASVCYQMHSARIERRERRRARAAGHVGSMERHVDLVGARDGGAELCLVGAISAVDDLCGCACGLS